MFIVIIIFVYKNLKLKKSQDKTTPKLQFDIEALNRPKTRQVYTEELDRRLEQLEDGAFDPDERVCKLNTAIQEVMKATILAETNTAKALDLREDPRDGKNQEAVKAETTGVK